MKMLFLAVRSRGFVAYPLFVLVYDCPLGSCLYFPKVDGGMISHVEQMHGFP